MHPYFAVIELSNLLQLSSESVKCWENSIIVTLVLLCNTFKALATDLTAPFKNVISLSVRGLNQSVFNNSEVICCLIDIALFMVLYEFHLVSVDIISFLLVTLFKSSEPS